MTATHTMNPMVKRTSPRALARIGGLLYLLIILGGLFAPFAIAPSGMMLGNGALPTVNKILSLQSLYVLGGAIQLFVYACDIGVALVFYELLKPVSKRVALLATFFRLVFVAVACANMVNHFVPLVFLVGSDSLTSFTTDQLQALAIAFIRLRTFGFDIALLFFGFHCMLVGYLIFRSTFLPRVLGAALAIGGVGYVVNILTTAIPLTIRVHLFPYVMLSAGFAEVLLTLWLLIVGLNVTKWKDRAEAAVLLS